MIEGMAEAVKETVVDTMGVTIKGKVKEIMNSNAVHNAKGNIYTDMIMASVKTKGRGCK